VASKRRAVGSRWDTGRTEAFSDGVFAIAITLLVLDINVPESDFDDLWYGIAHQWPSYVGYVTSFVTIGGLWLAHHGIFRRIQYADARVTRLNLLLLMVVSFLPFPTRLMSEAIRDSDAETAAAVFYGTTLLAISIITWALWNTVARNRELLKVEVTDEEVRTISRLTAPNIGGYAVGILLARLAPQAAVFAFLATSIIALLRARGAPPEESGHERHSRTIA
jgi:uncharacterized membrane protein